MEASIEERIAYLGDLKERLTKRVSLRHKALLRAYPQINSKRFDIAIDGLKKRIEKISIIK